MSTKSTENRFKFTETLRIRVPRLLHQMLLRDARRTHRKPSEVARCAVVRYLEQNGDQQT